MAEVEAAVVQKTVDLLYRRMIRNETGDSWHDHRIGDVRFAMEEKALCRAVNDERHIALFQTYGDVVWETLTAALADCRPAGQ